MSDEFTWERQGIPPTQELEDLEPEDGLEDEPEDGLEVPHQAVDPEGLA